MPLSWLDRYIVFCSGENGGGLVLVQVSLWAEIISDLPGKLKCALNLHPICTKKVLIWQ